MFPDPRPCLNRLTKLRLTKSSVPSQMPDTVERVEGEWDGEDELDTALDPSRQTVH
jgi:hypothetical protein